MKKLFLGGGVLFLVFLMVAPASALNTTASTDGEAMANALLGGGVTISNVVYSGADGAAGFFTGGTASGIGIDEGVVLTSGSVANIDGLFNTADNSTTNNGFPGDADAQSLIPGFSTNDATFLQFDFVSQSDGAFFNYLFGSEEYNEFTNSAFNDVFGFFVEGPDLVKDNYALIPGTDTPVSINNVNGGNPFGTNATNSEFYNNNDPNDPASTFPFEYDGFTDVFTASILGLTPGETYTIKMVIADAGDFVLDSGVFLEAGTFSDKPPEESVPEPGTVFMLGLGLVGLAGYSRRKIKR